MPVELNPTTFSIQTLYRMFRDGDFYVDRRYQRKLVWTLEEKQKLVDSVLREFPIPLVLLAKRPDGKFDIIDGLQRLHTLISFIENAFQTSAGKLFDVRELPRAAQAAKDGAWEIVDDGNRLLTASDCASISEYVLPVTIVERADNQDVMSIFERINSYGRRLSEQEQRQAGLASKFSQLVRNISCEIRGDVSEDTVPLAMMPDSLDEQSIADILACILNKVPVQRSRAALDRIYTPGTRDATRFEGLLSSYGEDDIRRDF